MENSGIALRKFPIVLRKCIFHNMEGQFAFRDNFVPFVDPLHFQQIKTGGEPGQLPCAFRRESFCKEDGSGDFFPDSDNTLQFVIFGFVREILLQIRGDRIICSLVQRDAERLRTAQSCGWIERLKVITIGRRFVENACGGKVCRGQQNQQQEEGFMHYGSLLFR